MRIYDRALGVDEIKSIGGDPIKSLLAIDKKERSKEQKMALLNHYLNNNDDEYKRLVAIKNDVNKKKSDLLAQKKVTSMIMQDNPEAKKRITYILNRGQYDQPI